MNLANRALLQDQDVVSILHIFFSAFKGTTWTCTNASGV
jgi:hypothetical protein